MSKQLEFDFGEEFKNRDKIVDVCPSTGTGITQDEVDVFNAAVKTRLEKARTKALLKDPEMRKLVKELLNV
jgi:hypothetical protein